MAGLLGSMGCTGIELVSAAPSPVAATLATSPMTEHTAYIAEPGQAAFSTPHDVPQVHSRSCDP